MNMNRKLLLISGIILMMLITSVSTIVVAEPNDTENLGRTRIRAIGSFSYCDDEEVLYGHIFIGLMGFQPVFNLDIEINGNSIRWLIMRGFGVGQDVQVYRYLNCVIVE